MAMQLFRMHLDLQVAKSASPEDSRDWTEHQDVSVFEVHVNDEETGFLYTHPAMKAEPVGNLVGVFVGAFVGTLVGVAVGADVGADVGDGVTAFAANMHTRHLPVDSELSLDQDKESEVVTDTSTSPL